MSNTPASPNQPPLKGSPPRRRWIRMLNRGSLRYQLTVGILMVLLPCFAVSYAGLNRLSTEEITRLTENRLAAEAELLSYGLREWGEANRLMLKSLSFDASLRRRDPLGSQRLLNSMQSLYPHREWRYWTVAPQPKLLAYTGDLTPDGIRRAEKNVLSRPYFRDALNGQPSYSVVKSYANNKTCVMIAQPVYPDMADNLQAARRSSVEADVDAMPPGRRSVAKSAKQVFTGQHAAGVNPLEKQHDINHLLKSQTPRNERPTGVLLSCILLKTLGLDTGLQEALGNTYMSTLQGGVSDFTKREKVHTAFMLVSRHGHILYPTTSSSGQDIPTIKDYLQGAWSPIFRQALEATRGKESFTKVAVGNQRYFVLINKADEAWSTMLILNEEDAFASLYSLKHILVLFGLACLIIASAAVYWRCGHIIAPIRRAGEALQSISEGNFDTVVEHSRDDEIGALLDNVNHASAQLKLYLSKETANAIIQKQLQTAREIQKDFLVSKMPESAALEIAPIFLPAYEVGADWYDAVSIDGTVYFVVADVCDKGIPSALYMSVFRSLLRYGLLAHSGTDVSPGCRLQAVITGVNDYMATNHGDSMMFATVFMGAIHPDRGDLHYISAGHEMPLICRPDSHQLLEQTGPAVGLFAGATYTAGLAALQPGDYLVAYTDGLTDARSPANVGWGRQALVAFMAERAGGRANADTVLQDLVATVQSYMAGTEPFDDLTVMVLHRPA